MRPLLVLLWFFSVSPAWGEPLTLSRYAGNLVTAEVIIGGQPARMLFDTGAGVTSITPAFAQRIGCTPHGSLTGFRISGERVAFQKCEQVRLAIGQRHAVRDIGVFDLSAVLPTDLPPLDGVIGLDSFDGAEFTLRLSTRAIDVGHRQGRNWREGEMRMQREIGGLGVSIFTRVEAADGSLWMLLDSGNLGPVLLSPGAVSQLGATSTLNSLSISGVGRHEVQTEQLVSSIYDGNLGWAFMRDFDIALDLRHNRIWWRPAQH